MQHVTPDTIPILQVKYCLATTFKSYCAGIYMVKIDLRSIQGLTSSHFQIVAEHCEASSRPYPDTKSLPCLAWSIHVKPKNPRNPPHLWVGRNKSNTTKKKGRGLRKGICTSILTFEMCDDACLSNVKWPTRHT